MQSGADKAIVIAVGADARTDGRGRHGLRLARVDTARQLSRRKVLQASVARISHIGEHAPHPSHRALPAGTNDVALRTEEYSGTVGFKSLIGQAGNAFGK